MTDKVAGPDGSALSEGLGPNAQPCTWIDRNALTADYAEIEARCRKAFVLEDGYGIPSEHPERYRVFRDGFFASWMRARSDLGA